MEPDQPNYAKGGENFANEPPLQLTLRVMQDIYSNARFWIGALAVTAILTVAGPFDTLNDMEFAPRLVYWAAISLATWPMGMASSIYFGTSLFQQGVPEVLSRVIGGLIGGIPIGVFVWLINRFIAGSDIDGLDDLLRLIVYTMVISAAVSLIYYLVAGSVNQNRQPLQASPATIPGSEKTTPAPFFARLPVALGKDLISLQAQDHYIKATTTKGSDMILMRLADAEKELEPVSGIRTHRSWWVAKAHIRELRRDGEKLVILLSDETKVPVSRTYARDVRDFIGE